MKRILFGLLCCAFSFNVYAQEDDLPIVIAGDEGGDDLTFRVTFEAGITNFHPWQLNALYFNHEGYRELKTYGGAISFSMEPYIEDSEKFPGAELMVAFHVFPNDERYYIAANGEATRYRLKGWELMTNTLALNLVRRDYFDFVTGFGAFYGNLKLDVQNLQQGEGGSYTNPFFAPMFRTDIRFNFWKITIGGRFSYRYDLTKDNWKRKTEGDQAIPGYSFREAQFLLYIGYRDVEYGY